MDTLEQTAEGLTDAELAVARWISQAADRNGEFLSSQDVADRLDCHRSTVQRMAMQENVRQHARALIYATMRFDELPKLTRFVLDEAMKDKHFGLKTLRWLEGIGMDPFSGAALDFDSRKSKPQPAAPADEDDDEEDDDPATETRETHEQRVRRLSGADSAS